MRKKIRGLIAMVILLICFSVPAAAATESFHFEQKTASVQVGKTKELSVYNNGRKVDPKKVQWKSSNPKLAAISNGKVTAKCWKMFPLSYVAAIFIYKTLHQSDICLISIACYQYKSKDNHQIFFPVSISTRSR